MDGTGLARGYYIEVMQGNLLCKQDYKSITLMFVKEYKYSDCPLHVTFK